MNQALKSTLIIFLGVFATFNFALAQVSNPPQGTIIQNQPPAVNYENIPPQEEEKPPSTKEATPPQVVPQEIPVLTEEEIQPQVVPQETSPEIPVVENTTAQKSMSQINLSSPVAYVTYAVVVILVFFWFGAWWRRWLKRKKKTELPSEAEDKKPPAEAEKLVCPTCGGTGKITKHRTKTAPCTHCKETGIDICHHCSGTGKDGCGGFGVQLEDIEGYPDCGHCGGKGSPEIVLPCEFCKGKRKIEFQEPYEETCPTCKGLGWIRNW